MIELWRTKTPIAPISESGGISDPEIAYAIPSQWSNIRLKRGKQIAGRKIGLTNKAVQRQMGVEAPDCGTLWKPSFYEAKNGKVTTAIRNVVLPLVR